MTVHGGNVWQAASDLGVSVAGLLDFSANINPRGLPPSALRRLAREASDPASLARYPDPAARELRHALSANLAIPAECLLIGAGAAALLAAAFEAIRPTRCLVPVPAFSEYRRLCDSAGAEFVRFPLEAGDGFRLPVARFCRALAAQRYDLVILNYPHNPSGAMLELRELRDVVEAALDCGSILLADEAFVDYAPEASLAAEAALRPGLLVVRSLTKFYGCPALRAGYAAGHPRTLERLSAIQPAWPVTGLALSALAEAVRDREYAWATRRENALRAEDLAQGLRGLGLQVFPTAANFLLFRLAPEMPAAAILSDRLLCDHHILIRNCDSYEALEPGRYIRVAVRTAEENDRLLAALRKTVLPQ